MLPVLGNHCVENPILIRDQNGILRGILRECSTRFSFKVKSISNSRRAVLCFVVNSYYCLKKRGTKPYWPGSERYNWSMDRGVKLEFHGRWCIPSWVNKGFEIPF